MKFRLSDEQRKGEIVSGAPRSRSAEVVSGGCLAGPEDEGTEDEERVTPTPPDEESFRFEVGTKSSTQLPCSGRSIKEDPCPSSEPKDLSSPKELSLMPSSPTPRSRSVVANLVQLLVFPAAPPGPAADRPRGRLVPGPSQDESAGRWNVSMEFMSSPNVVVALDGEVLLPPARAPLLSPPRLPINAASMSIASRVPLGQNEPPLSEGHSGREGTSGRSRRSPLGQKLSLAWLVRDDTPPPPGVEILKTSGRRSSGGPVGSVSSRCGGGGKKEPPSEEMS